MLFANHKNVRNIGIKGIAGNKRLLTFFDSKKEECFDNNIVLPNSVGELGSSTVELNNMHLLVRKYTSLHYRGCWV